MNGKVWPHVTASCSSLSVIWKLPPTTEFFLLCWWPNKSSHVKSKLFQTNTLFNWWVNVSGHVITTELATPISELKPLNCCDLAFLGKLWRSFRPADRYKNLVMIMWVYNTVWTSSSARMSFPGTLKPHKFQKVVRGCAPSNPASRGEHPLKSPVCTF